MSTIRPTTEWVKAKKSGNQGQCVELRSHDGNVEVRDTKAKGDGPTLKFSDTAFRGLLDAAKSGKLDHLM